MLVAISKMSDAKRKKSRAVAERCLLIAEQRGFIQPSDREIYERKTHISTVPDEKDCILTTRYSDDESDDEDGK